MVVSWLLIQVVETVFPLFGFDDAPARIVVIVLAIGFVPALVFAWAFELTPEGLKKEKDVDRNHSATSHTGKKLDRVIMLLLVVALGYFAFDKFVLDPARDAELVKETAEKTRSDALVTSYGDKSIAVLPFADMSQEGDQEYFSDGISEELLNLLAKIPELRVISRTSAFSFKGKDIDIPTIAAQLNVAHILEGSVRTARNQIRITAQLIDASSDSHLWSETYDRDLSDIFSVQDEIAAAVVKQLKLTILQGTAKQKEPDPRAYTLLLQGNHFSRMMTAEGLQKALDMYLEALEIDPDFTRAWVSLSSIYSKQGVMHLLPPKQAKKLAFEAIELALNIAPEDAHAHGAMAWFYMTNNGDLARAAQHYQKALSLDPTNTTIISNAAMLVESLGRVEEANKLLNYCVSRDPTNSIIFNNFGINSRFSGKLDKAEASLSTALSLNPSMLGVYYELGVTQLLKQDYEAAVAAFKKEPSEVFQTIGLVMAYHALGQLENSDRLLDQVIKSWGKYVGYYVAQVLAFRGEIDQSFEWLNKAVLAKDGDLTTALNEPLFKNLHQDSRWLMVLEKLGQSPDQLAVIEFEVALPD